MIRWLTTTAPLLQTSVFPWWYTALLSRHMPHWLIKALENPTIIATIVAIIILTKLTTLHYLAKKLRAARKLNTELQEQHAALIKEHSLLQKAYDQQKTMNEQLTTLLTRLIPQQHTHTNQSGFQQQNNR